MRKKNLYLKKKSIFFIYFVQSSSVLSYFLSIIARSSKDETRSFNSITNWLNDETWSFNSFGSLLRSAQVLRACGLIRMHISIYASDLMTYQPNFLEKMGVFMVFGQKESVPKMLILETSASDKSATSEHSCRHLFV